MPPWRPSWQFSGKHNEIKAICAIHPVTSPNSNRREQDGKGKATPSGARKWLIGLGFLAIRSQPADGGKGTFFKEFNGPTAIRHLGSLTRLLALLQYDNYIS